jgi:hypothetical protein
VRVYIGYCILKALQVGHIHRYIRLFSKTRPPHQSRILLELSPPALNRFDQLILEGVQLYHGLLLESMYSLQCALSGLFDLGEGSLVCDSKQLKSSLHVLLYLFDLRVDAMKLIGMELRVRTFINIVHLKFSIVG